MLIVLMVKNKIMQLFHFNILFGAHQVEDFILFIFNFSKFIVFIFKKFQSLKLIKYVLLCVGNYATHDGLFNGGDGVFRYVSKLLGNESLVWIAFNNPKVGSTIRI